MCAGACEREQIRVYVCAADVHGGYQLSGVLLPVLNRFHQKNVLIHCHTWLSIHHLTLLRFTRRPEEKRQREAAQEKVQVVEKEVLNWSGMPALTSLLALTCPQSSLKQIYRIVFFSPSRFFQPARTFAFFPLPHCLCLSLSFLFFFPSLSGLTSLSLSLTHSLSPFLSPYIHTPAAMGNPSKSIIHASLLLSLSLVSHHFSLCRPLCLCVCVCVCVWERETEREREYESNRCSSNLSKWQSSIILGGGRVLHLVQLYEKKKKWASPPSAFFTDACMIIPICGH